MFGKKKTKEESIAGGFLNNSVVKLMMPKLIKKMKEKNLQCFIIFINPQTDELDAKEIYHNQIILIEDAAS